MYSAPVGNGKMVPHSGQNLGSLSNTDIFPPTISAVFILPYKSAETSTNCQKKAIIALQILQQMTGLKHNLGAKTKKLHNKIGTGANNDDVSVMTMLNYSNNRNLQ